ncbi:transmembrane protein 91-like [Argopecten irradians]|uniref:transmembrane protein 91-like n=1 Tax=Argopecten irradians TaxID=31199 RepID=UPI00371917C0
MTDYQQFTDEEFCPSSPSIPRPAYVSESPPPYFPPTDEGNAQYTWGVPPAPPPEVTSPLPIDGPRPPPYIADDAPPPFEAQDTSPGQSSPTSVVVQQPNSSDQPSMPPVVPNDYLGWSICSCLCCVWSLGVCAILSSYDSRKAAYKGDLTNAKASSLCALRINIVNMVLGIFIIIYCLLRFGLGF